MRVPTIHLNGTSAEAIRHELCEAAMSLGDAIRAIERAGPNARDYYVQEPNAFNEAVAEHTARVAKLREVASELEAIFSAVCAQET